MMMIELFSRDDLTVQQNALLGFMRYVSEDRWATVWDRDLEYALLDPRYKRDLETYRWLVEQAGGWFTYDGATRFVPGAFDELAAGYKPPSKPEPRYDADGC